MSIMIERFLAEQGAMSREHTLRGRHLLLTALLGAWSGLAVLAGGLIGSRTTLDVQREQAQEAHRTEARIKRAAVYHAFLDAADAAIVPSFRAAERCAGHQCKPRQLEDTIGPQSERLTDAAEEVEFTALATPFSHPHDSSMLSQSSCGISAKSPKLLRPTSMSNSKMPTKPSFGSCAEK